MNLIDLFSSRRGSDSLCQGAMFWYIGTRHRDFHPAVEGELEQFIPCPYRSIYSPTLRGSSILFLFIQDSYSVGGRQYLGIAVIDIIVPCTSWLWCEEFGWYGGRPSRWCDTQSFSYRLSYSLLCYSRPVCAYDVTLVFTLVLDRRIVVLRSQFRSAQGWSSVSPQRREGELSKLAGGQRNHVVGSE